MVCTPGSGGPVPKRASQRRRQNKDQSGLTPTSVPGAAVVERPEPDEAWHAAARRWYEALGGSGQAQFYEPSDWAQAFVWAELLSRALQMDRVPAHLVAAWASGAAELLTTEGARRRLRIELERPKPVDADEDAAVAALDAYRRRLSG